MRLARPLDDLFRSPSYVGLLRALSGLPVGYRASARELARRAGVSHPVELKVLSSLVRQGIVQPYRIANADTYELNRSHSLFELIADVFKRESGLRQDLLTFLRGQIVTHAPSARQAYVFGSAASGELKLRSDIDVAVFWPGASSDQVDAASEAISEALRRRYGNPGQVIVNTAKTAEQSVRAGRTPRIWSEIVRTGLPILGPDGSEHRAKAARRRSA